MRSACIRLRWIARRRHFNPRSFGKFRDLFIFFSDWTVGEILRYSPKCEERGWGKNDALRKTEKDGPSKWRGPGPSDVIEKHFMCYYTVVKKKKPVETNWTVVVGFYDRTVRLVIGAFVYLLNCVNGATPRSVHRIRMLCTMENTPYCYCTVASTSEPRRACTQTREKSCSSADRFDPVINYTINLLTFVCFVKS